MRNILLLCILLKFHITFSNPLSPPPVLSELYFEGGNWYIELVLSGNDSENYAICTSTDTVFLLPGLTEGILIISVDSLQEYLYIDPFGDLVDVIYVDYSYNYPMIYGDFPGAVITAPYPGQSLVFQQIEHICLPDPSTFSYMLVKESSPSLGFNPFYCSTKGTIYGYVTDLTGNPFPDVCVFHPSMAEYYPINPYPPYVVSNDTGYFESEIFGMHYDLTLVEQYGSFDYSEQVLADTSINIEPDSSYFFNFVIDTVLTKSALYSKSDSKINLYPVPADDVLHISLPAQRKASDLIVKVFTEEGVLVKIIPFAYLPNEKQSELIIQVRDLKSGNYYLNLEQHQKKIASEKFIIQ